jgi:hypothetical protein
MTYADYVVDLNFVEKGLACLGGLNDHVVRTVHRRILSLRIGKVDQLVKEREDAKRTCPHAERFGTANMLTIEIDG